MASHSRLLICLSLAHLACSSCVLVRSMGTSHRALSLSLSLSHLRSLVWPVVIKTLKKASPVCILKQLHYHQKQLLLFIIWRIDLASILTIKYELQFSCQLTVLNYLGNLINDFASRLASNANSLDLDSNGHLNLGSSMGGKKKKKKRRHR